MGKLVKDAGNHNIEFIHYYKDLYKTHETPTNCENALKREFRNIIEEKIKSTAENDIDPKVGTYLEINPQLCEPKYKGLLEYECVCITRYRTGSHNLKVETGRCNIRVTPREESLCICNNDIQTLRHVILRCPLVGEVRVKYKIETTEEALLNPNFLMEMENKLKI